MIAILLIVSLLATVSAHEQDTHNPVEHIRMSNAEYGLEHLKAEVTVNVTEVEGKNAWVEVSWSGFKSPSFDDWIGVLAPADAHVKHTTPVKYKLAGSVKSHLKSGSGSVNFLLENHRTDLRIGFFYNGFTHPRLAGHTPPIRFLTPDRPAHGRLSLTGDSTEMLVQWTTATNKQGYVLWGTDAENLDRKAPSRTLTYTRDEMCGGAAQNEGWLDPGVFHNVLLKGLVPGGRYFYRFGGDAVGLSDVFTFTAAPAPGPDTPVDILLLADMGQGEPDGSMEQSEMVPSLDTTRYMIRDAFAGQEGGIPDGPDAFQLVAHYGDISYARGHVSQWDRYHEQIEPLVARVPYMVGIGNHERDWPHTGDRFGVQHDSGGECGVAHERRFLMPSERQDEPWFTYDFGPVRFIHYSTEHHFAPGSPQHHFVKRILKQTDRSVTPWVIFAGHRPIYIDSTSKKGPAADLVVADQLQDAFEELLLQHHVDMTLHGHHHSYQRTCPLRRGECAGFDNEGVAQGPVHLVIGNAGAGLCLNIHEKQPKVFEKVHLWWGSQRLHANATHLRVDAVSNKDGLVFDSVTLSKPVGWGDSWHQQNGPPSPDAAAGHKGRRKWWWEHDVIGEPPQVARYNAARLGVDAAAAMAAAQNSLRSSRRAEEQR